MMLNFLDPAGCMFSVYRRLVIVKLKVNNSKDDSIVVGGKEKISFLTCLVINTGQIEPEASVDSVNNSLENTALSILGSLIESSNTKAS